MSPGIERSVILPTPPGGPDTLKNSTILNRWTL